MVYAKFFLIMIVQIVCSDTASINVDFEFYNDRQILVKIYCQNYSIEDLDIEYVLSARLVSYDLPIRTLPFSGLEKAKCTTNVNK